MLPDMPWEQSYHNCAKMTNGIWLCSCLDVLHSLHNHRLDGNPGIMKTISNIKHQFYWLCLSHFVIDHIHLCTQCHQIKSIHHKPFGPHCFVPIVNWPWDSISKDFIKDPSLRWP